MRRKIQTPLLLRDFTLAMRQDIPVKIMFADYVAGDKADQVSGTQDQVAPRQLQDRVG